MAKRPAYEELEKRIKELEREAAEHKRTEEALRESEQKYKTLTDSSLVGVFIHQDSKYVFVTMHSQKCMDMSLKNCMEETTLI